MLLTTLLLTCCLAAPAEVTVDSESITLGALIPFSANDARASISLGYAPNPGLARRFAKYEILGKITSLGLPVDDLQIPESMLVRRRASTLDRDQVMQAIRDAFTRQFPGASVEILSVELPGLQVGTGPVDIKASLPSRFDVAHAVFVRLDVRGTTYSRTAFVRTSVKVDGQQTSEIYIRKGDSVTVKATFGGVTIAAIMRAKAAGRLGDTIQVEHLTGQGTTTARIVGPATLEAFF